MRVSKFEYFAPKTLQEACALLSQYKESAKVLAGGTDLLVAMKQRTLTPKQVVNLKGIPGLDSIDYNEKEGLRVGALTTLQALETSLLVREKFPILSQAAHKVASVQIRNMATLGGNICLNSRCWYYNQPQWWRGAVQKCFKTGGEVCHVAKGANWCYALFSADTVPALMGLGARVKVTSLREERLLPLGELYTGRGEPVTTLKPDEFITEVQIPPIAPNTRGAYLKHTIPAEGIDFPLVGVAAVITVEDGVCQDSRIVMSGVVSGPLKATDAEKVLKGKRIEDDLIEQVAEAALKQARPITHMGVSAAYRRRMVQVFVKRAIKQALLQTKS